MRAFRSLALVLTLACCGTTLAADVPDPVADTEFVSDWVLVQLHTPLPPGKKLADGTFSLDTDSAPLNAAIRDRGVHRIDHALSESMSTPRRPEALARYGLDRVYRFHVPGGTDVEDLVERLSDLPEVAYAEPDYRFRPMDTTPNDPKFLDGDQWGLHSVFDYDVDAPEAWDISTGSGIIIAVIDTGIDSSHEEFPESKLVAGWNFDDNNDDVEDSWGHGAGVASVASASTNNDKGIAGVCWDCRIMPLVAGLGSAMTDALVFAADNGARVVNISQGIFTNSQTTALGLGYAYDSGLIVVAAAGNHNNTPIGFPARAPEVVAVGATDERDDRVEPFCSGSGAGSSYGPLLDVVAPGDMIWVVYGANAPGGVPNGYSVGCGTSFASPLVAGSVGVMETVNSSIGREEARHLIRSGADDQVGRVGEDTPGFDDYMGWGRVNLHQTLEGTRSAMTLRVEGGQSTRVYMDTANPLADSYDFVRGDLAALSEDWQGVDLGDVVCLEDDSPDPDTMGNEDTEIPPSGEAFFYLARFNGAPGAGSYGGSTHNRDRVVIGDPAAGWIRNGEQTNTELGFSVAGAGDVNNDTFADVIVGARHYSNDQVHEGGAFLYLGSPDGLQLAPAWIAEGDQTDSDFGRRVASAGDVNGDGYDDVIVGAQYHDNGEADEGRAYLFLGSAQGLGVEAVWTAESDQAGALFGRLVAPAGDINADGYDDVIVTATDFDGGHENEGRAYVYYGSSSGLGEVLPWTFESNQAGARLGLGGGGAGDINNDGYDDIVIGALRYDNGETDEGRLFVFLGSELGPVSPPTTIEINVPGARLGRAATGAGDVNGDGFDDVIAGAVKYTGGEAEEGAAFLFLGSSGGITTTPAWSFENDQPYSRVGTAVASAGDVNLDGYADVIVGADHYDSTRTDEGRAWVFFGSASGLSEEPDWLDSPGQSNAWFGWAVAGAGNVDGDPYDDIIVGAYGHDDIANDEGRIYLYHGSSSGPETASVPLDCGK